MTVEELKKLLDKMPKFAKIGYWDGDYSIFDPCPAKSVHYDKKRKMVVLIDDYEED